MKQKMTPDKRTRTRTRTRVGTIQSSVNDREREEKRGTEKEGEREETRVLRSKSILTGKEQIIPCYPTHPQSITSIPLL